MGPDLLLMDGGISKVHGNEWMGCQSDIGDGVEYCGVIQKLGPDGGNRDSE